MVTKRLILTYSPIVIECKKVCSTTYLPNELRTKSWTVKI